MQPAKAASFPVLYFSRRESKRYREIHTSSTSSISGPVKLLEAASTGQTAAKKQAAERNA